jgi:hypothetical protein
MTVLAWHRRRPTVSRLQRTVPNSFSAVGAYAGRARFQPCDGAVVTPTLQRAIGQVIEVGFAGIAPAGELFAGQALYLEWRGDRVLDGFLIPEQDLEFVDRRRSVSCTLSFPSASSTSARSSDGGAA